MDAFKLPRSTLDKLTTAAQKGVLVALLELVDDNGRVLISVREFAKTIGMEYQPLRTTLNHIYANAIANAIPTQRLTQITINNIADYSVSPRKHQRNTNATTNAITEMRKTQKFIPPTEQEVKDYVLEKGYHFNPVQFVPFYQSKGWMVGRNPMKDWKAACQTWEIEWKKKYGEQFYHQINESKQTNAPRNLADARAAERAEMADQLRDVLGKLGSSECQCGAQC